MSVDEGEYNMEHMANMAARPAAMSVPGLARYQYGYRPDVSRHSLCRVQRIRRSRRRDILVPTPIRLTRIKRPDRDIDGIRVRMSLRTRRVSSKSGRKARGTYVHRPVETPSEHRVEVSRLVGRVVARAVGIGAPAYGEGGLREDGVSRGAESQGSRRRSEREMHRERFVKGHLMLFDGRSQSADMALSEDDRKAERHRKLSNSRIASRSSFQRMREVTMLSNPVLPFFTPSYDGLDKRLHCVQGNRAVLSIRHASTRFSEHRSLSFCTLAFLCE